MMTSGEMGYLGCRDPEIRNWNIQIGAFSTFTQIPLGILSSGLALCPRCVFPSPIGFGILPEVWFAD
jgi:hypothetical protein